MTRATSTRSPSRREVSLMSMGRFTPVTISTRGERKGRLTLVGVPPNMSVRIRTSPPPTSARAWPILSREAAMSSAQPMETAAMAGTSPTMLRAALTSSPATCPWLTTTIPITPASRLPQVPVAHAHSVALARDGLAQGVGHHDRAVPPARAAHGDGEVALALPDVARDHVGEQAAQLAQEGEGVGLPLHVAHHRRVVPGQGLELGHEVRVGQEAHVEDQVGLRGHAELVGEGEHGDDQRRGPAAQVVVLLDVVAQLVDGEVRGVEDVVGHLADGLQGLALLADPLDGR